MGGGRAGGAGRRDLGADLAINYRTDDFVTVLAAKGIKPDVIVGTSAGSVVATLYASGKSPNEMANIAERVGAACRTSM